MRARTHGPRSFDAVAVGQGETDAWVAYYRHEWLAFLRASVAVDPGLVRPAAVWRVKAVDLSDEWVRRGCSSTDPLLSDERRALVASHAALLDAVSRARG